MADEFDALLQAIGISNTNLSKDSDTVKGILAEQKSAQEDQLVQIKTAGEQSQIVDQAKQMAELKAQKQALATSTQLGTNPDAATSILGPLADEFRSATLETIARRKEVQALMDVKFLEHPVDYIIASAKLPEVAAAADYAAGRRDDVLRALTTAQQATQQSAASYAAVAQTKTDATVEASLKQAQASLQSNLDQVKINNAGINTKGVEELTKISLQQLNNTSTAFHAKQQVQQLAISKANLANSTKALEAQLAERQEKIDQKKADRVEMDEFAAVVKRGAAVLGYTDVAAFPTSKIIQLMNMKADGFQDFLKVGMQSVVAGNPVISDNAGDAARIINTTKAPMRPEQSKLKTFFQSVWGDVHSPENTRAGGYDVNKLDQVTNAAGRFAVNKAAEQHNNIKQGDNTNLYAPPAMKSIIDMPAIKSSPLVQKALGVQFSTNALQEFNPNQLISLTVAAIKEGKVTFNEGVTGLQGMFNGAKQINNATNNYSSYGLPNQTGYKTKVPARFIGTETKDLTKTEDLTALLTRQLAALRREEELAKGVAFKGEL